MRLTQVFALHQSGATQMNRDFFFFLNHKKNAGVGNQGIWATGIVAKFFQDSGREDFFPWAKLANPQVCHQLQSTPC